MCARHIIAAGLERVVYIEPYPKSRAKKLYKNAIQVDEDQHADQDAVKFERLLESPKPVSGTFDMVPRKDSQGYAFSATSPGEAPKGVALGHWSRNWNRPILIRSMRLTGPNCQRPTRREARMTGDTRVSRLMALASDAKSRTSSWSAAKQDYALASVTRVLKNSKIGRDRGKVSVSPNKAKPGATGEVY